MATSWTSVTSTKANTTDNFTTSGTTALMPDMTFTSGANSGTSYDDAPQGYIYLSSVIDGITPAELKDKYFPRLTAIQGLSSSASYFEVHGWVGSLITLDRHTSSDLSGTGPPPPIAGYNVFSLTFSEGDSITSNLFTQSVSPIFTLISNTRAKDMATSWNLVTTTDIASTYAVPSLQFDGVDDVVTISDSNNWEFGTGPFTISLWAKFDTVTADRGMIGQFVDSNDFWTFYWSSSNRLYFQSISTSWKADYHVASFTPTVDTWYHFLVKRNGTTLTMYINGTEYTVGNGLTQTTAIASNALANFSGDLLVGKDDRASGALFMDGYLSNIAIFDDDLDSDAITEIYNSGVPFDLAEDRGYYDEYTDNLKGYWRCHEGTGEPQDTSGESLHGTITGASWVEAGMDVTSLSNSFTVVSNTKAKVGSTS